jgi:TonB family protein
VLEARVDEGGFVRDVRVATQAHPALEQAAVQAVAQWQFTPTLLNCVPVEIGMTATVHFSEK